METENIAEITSNKNLRRNNFRFCESLTWVREREIVCKTRYWTSANGCDTKRKLGLIWNLKRCVKGCTKRKSCKVGKWLNHCILIVAALVWFFTVCDMMNLYVCLWLGFVIIKLVYGESMFGPRLLAAHQVKSFLIGINTIT
jgi:hypothetical protein